MYDILVFSFCHLDSFHVFEFLTRLVRVSIFLPKRGVIKACTSRVQHLAPGFQEKEDVHCSPLQQWVEFFARLTHGSFEELEPRSPYGSKNSGHGNVVDIIIIPCVFVLLICTTIEKRIHHPSAVD